MSPICSWQSLGNPSSFFVVAKVHSLSWQLSLNFILFIALIKKSNLPMMVPRAHNCTERLLNPTLFMIIITRKFQNYFMVISRIHTLVMHSLWIPCDWISTSYCLRWLFICCVKTNPIWTSISITRKKTCTFD